MASSGAVANCAKLLNRHPKDRQLHETLRAQVRSSHFRSAMPEFAREPSACFKAVLNNTWVGFGLFAAIVLELSVWPWLATG